MFDEKFWFKMEKKKQRRENVGKKLRGYFNGDMWDEDRNSHENGSKEREDSTIISMIL